MKKEIKETEKTEEAEEAETLEEVLDRGLLPDIFEIFDD